MHGKEEEGNGRPASCAGGEKEDQLGKREREREREKRHRSPSREEVGGKRDAGRGWNAGTTSSELEKHQVKEVNEEVLPVNSACPPLV